MSISVDGDYLFLYNDPSEIFRRVYSDVVMSSIRETLGSKSAEVDGSSLGKDFCAPNAKYIFSSWNMPVLSEGEIARMFPRLECVFYAAGTVKYFADPYFKRGVRVFSAASVNAVPVAEYAASAICLATKGFFNARVTPLGHFFNAKKRAANYPGNYRAKVGILGAGSVGRDVIARIMRETDLFVMVYDPYVSEEECEKLGCKKGTLEEVFSECDVISNHMPDVPETRGIINARMLSQLKPTAGLINTGRGAQIVEKDLVDVLRRGPQRFAVLDVTHPEPIRPWNPLLWLRNVYVTPHIAGSVGNEVERLGLAMSDEARRIVSGCEAQLEVLPDQLGGIA